VMFPQCVT